MYHSGLKPWICTDDIKLYCLVLCCIAFCQHSLYDNQSSITAIRKTLCCTALYCTVLYSVNTLSMTISPASQPSERPCAVLHCIVLYRILSRLYATTSPGSQPPERLCAVLHCIVLYCILLRLYVTTSPGSQPPERPCAVLCCIVLYCILSTLSLRKYCIVFCQDSM